jgi:hypothetical protein
MVCTCILRHLISVPAKRLFHMTLSSAAGSDSERSQSAGTTCYLLLNANKVINAIADNRANHKKATWTRLS